MLAGIFSPAIRVLPSYTAEEAEQAAWLAPLPAMPILFLLFLGLKTVFDAYPAASLTDIIKTVLGKYLGNLVVICYLLWIFLLVLLYTRYHADRLVTTIMPNTPLGWFSFMLLVVLAMAIRSGLTVIARMGEVIIYIVIIIFVILSALSLTNFTPENITPISYLDILPVMKGSMISLALWGYLLYLFFMGDLINDKENLHNQGRESAIFLGMVSIILLFTTIGSLSHYLVAKMPIPYLSSIRIISIYETIERLESLVVAVWSITDFIILATFITIILHILKTLCGLQDTKSLVIPLCLLTYFGSMLLAGNLFQLESFSNQFVVPGNILFQFILPTGIFLIGKARRVF